MKPGGTDSNNNEPYAFENEYYDTVTFRDRSNNSRYNVVKLKPNMDIKFIVDEEQNESNNFEPHNPMYFKKRYCYKYVENPRTKACIGCKSKEIEGFHLGINFDSNWDYKKCTQISQTDAYGKLNFPGSHSKTANYIRVQNETNPSDMIEFLYSQKYQTSWGLHRPQLILSVTGGAQKFTLPYRMKKAFKRGLVKAAASTGAWIITGGTNTGVMRLVGEAVADDFHNTNLTVLGIATWGKIAMRDRMIKKINTNYEKKMSLFEMGNKDDKTLREKNKIYKRESLLYAPEEHGIANSEDVLLDPNHTHFILVDDGSEDMFGKEIGFRARLEAELRRGKLPDQYEKMRKEKRKNSYNSIENEDAQSMIPMILIVVQGGPNTLLTVEESLKKNVPVLVLADSKGCADLIAFACSLNKPDTQTLEKLIYESKMFESLNATEYNKKSQEALNRLVYILSKIPENLINVFHLDSEECGSDIELPILRAFLNTRKNQHYENLKLALQWNRSDIAKNYIFTGEESFKPNQLANLMEMALLQNKPEFVELLLENGLNLKSFLVTRRLYFLYNSHRIYDDIKKAPLFQRFKKKYKNGHSDSSNKAQIITFHSLIKLLKDYLFEDFEPNFLPKDHDIKDTEQYLWLANKKGCSEDTNFDFGNVEVSSPEQNLFLWALLLNRIDIAILFWQIGEHQICSALFASNLLKSMSTRLSDLEHELIKSARDFEEMAIGVLNIFDKSTDDIINGVILLRKIPFYNLDCLQMAVEGDCQQFVALSSVQNLLTDIWYGKIQIKSGFKGKISFIVSCLSFGLLAPFCVFERREKLTHTSDRVATLKNIAVHNRKQNISEYIRNSREGLLKEYLANFEIKDKTQANLLPECCTNKESSSDSSTDDSDNDSNESIPKFCETKKLKSSKLATYWDLYKRFVHAPRVHFVYDAFFYILFLTLFSYTVLCELQFNTQVYVKETSNNESNSTRFLPSKFVARTVVKSPSICEYLLIYWIFSFIMEEFRQYFLGDSETKILQNRLLHYFANNWNYLDISGCFVFIIGMSLRFMSIYQIDETLFIASRIVLCADLWLWYLRLLHLSIVFKSLGPKLVMIQKMVKDLIFFMSIIAIFVCAFGVTTQATLYPGNELSFKLIRNILNKAYWPIYGEMRILDELNDCFYDPAINKTACPESSGVVFSYTALMLYMVIANILLVNLLIAMFSSTFQDVQDNTDQIWKFQRYRLVFEYYDSPILPPPLNFIAYFVSFVSYLREQVYYKRKNAFLQKAAAKLVTNNDKIEYKKDEIDLLLDREQKFAEEYIRLERKRDKDTTDSRLKSNSEKLESLEYKLNEVLEGRYKEISQISDSINWLMSQYETTNKKPPYITNFK